MFSTVILYIIQLFVILISENLRTPLGTTPPFDRTKLLRHPISSLERSDFQ